MKRILIAEHDRDTRRWLEELLLEQHFSIMTAANSRAAWEKLQRNRFDLVLLDDQMLRVNGVDILPALRKKRLRSNVIVLTSDTAPETLLAALRGHASACITRPLKRETFLALVNDSLAKKACTHAIEVISARPEWVELLVPCSLDVAERLETLMDQLETGLPEDVRVAVGQAFHELLMNAIEWGGKFNPNRKVRISFLRAKRMLMYRIADPGRGFKFAGLKHAAISHNGEPTKHGPIREKKGLRPGGFGLLLVKANVDELLYNEAQNEVVFVKYLD
jgi:two-component system, OmpR family, response regulator